jgi:hypothetical protein
VSYVGYKQREFPAAFEGKATVNMNPVLVPDVLEGNEVVITAQARGQVAAINQQITSTTIVNVISEEKIKEMPDANADEAIGGSPASRSSAPAARRTRSSSAA